MEVKKDLNVFDIARQFTRAELRQLVYIFHRDSKSTWNRQYRKDALHLAQQFYLFLNI